MDKKYSIVFAIAIAIGFVAMGWFVGGIVPLFVFSVATGGGLVLWLMTTYKVQVNPQKIIVPYLLAVILFMIHAYEEYITDFPGLLHVLGGFDVQESQFLTAVAFVIPIIWLFGAVLLMMQKHIGYYMLSFFFVAMTISELAHFIFPFMINGTFHYTSGMYTAALPLVPAGYGLYIVISEVKKARRQPV